MGYIDKNINKKTFKSDLPSSFVHEGVEITGTKNIVDKLNEYFTEIGPKLAKSINTSNKAQFNSYLTTPCAASFNFAYTNPDNIEKSYEISDRNPVRALTIFQQNCLEKLRI